MTSAAGDCGPVDADPVIDAQLVLHIARLARLDVSMAEVPSLVDHFTRMLEFVRTLEQVSLPSGTEPVDHAGGASHPVDATAAAPSSSGEDSPDRVLGDELLRIAPERDGAYFVVPRVVG
ncbi:MAG: aspartyl/glutamyl-tRNA amidotransferase subunit C [Planctomycetota bacterium]